MEVRLQKFLAAAGVGSRRRCEALIRSGAVTVNGQVVQRLGTRIVPGRDRVAVEDQPVALERKVYIALHKPAGCLCTNRDTHGRRRVLDLLPADLPRLFSVGRLDANSEGLLLLTNDGEFALRLAHPRYKLPKTYQVEVAGHVTAATVQRLLDGVRSYGELLQAAAVRALRHVGDGTQLTLVLKQGKKRQVRRMMAVVGHPVRRLVRVAIGSLRLGELKPAQWRYLSDEEVRKLLAETGPCS